MTALHDPRPKPPRWIGTVFRCILPCDGMREAILGDLHEEFSRDAARLGPDRARIRYRNRALGIFAHAVWDSVRWRTWASNHDARQPTLGSHADRASARPSRRELQRRWIAMRAGPAGSTLGVGIAVFAILGAGVVVNTSVFAAVDGAPPADAVPPDLGEALTLAPERAPADSPAPPTAALAAPGGPDEAIGARFPAPFPLFALGLMGAVVMIVCAAVAALVLCRAPGWTRRRAARGVRASPPAT